MKTLDESIATINAELDHIRILAEEYPNAWRNIDIVRRRVNELLPSVLNDDSRMWALSFVPVYRIHYNYFYIATYGQFDEHGPKALIKFRKIDKKKDSIRSIVKEYLVANPDFFKLCLEEEKKSYREEGL